MNFSISSKPATDIIQRRAEGQTIAEIASILGVDEVQVNHLLSQIPSKLIPRDKHKTPSHVLSKEDRQRGGAASQLTRQKQRAANFSRIKQLLSIDQRPVEFAAVTYFLRAGSPKQFSVIIPS